jgi:AraC family transcriptional regulator of arabinose operon
MRQFLVSFHIELMAGCTVDVPHHGGEVDRPTGMDGWILNLTTAGLGRVGRGATVFTTAPGRLLLFKPAVAHDYGRAAPAGEWTHQWVYFFPRSAWFEWLTWPEVSPGILSLDLSGHELLPRIQALFSELIATANGPWSRRVSLATSQLEQLLLWCDQANPQSHPGVDARIQAVLDHFSADLGAKHRITQLARIAGLSESRLAHLFRAQTGVAPLQYLEQQRIARARELLLMSGRPLAAIAEEIGMPDSTWFARVFRRQVGLSPRAYRLAGGRVP